jgi:hypothetical protein
MQYAHRPDDAHCAGCRSALALAAVTLGLADILEERDKWRARALQAEKQCGALEDELHDARRVH